ncbi:MAG: glycosyltransferase [Myxococcota bacterium]
MPAASPSPEPQNPLLSVVIPARNCGRALARTLRELFEKTEALDRMEVIVVDDGSTDDTREVAAEHPVELVELGSHGGAALARNAGARRARGEFLCFLDADCVPEAGALDTMLDHCLSGRDCVVGCYARESLSPRFGSRYKSLIHHSLFLDSPPQISWFWTGCGAVRRSIFEEVGGFDQELFPGVAGVEDHLLGVRLVQRGIRIDFDPRIVVSHDHPRSAAQVVRNDFDRAWQKVMISFLTDQFRDEAFATDENLRRVLSLDLLLLTLPLGLWFWPLPLAAFLLFLGLSARHFRRLWVGAPWLSLRFVLLDTLLLAVWQLGAVVGVAKALQVKLGSRS